MVMLKWRARICWCQVVVASGPVDLEARVRVSRVARPSSEIEVGVPSVSRAVMVIGVGMVLGGSKCLMGLEVGVFGGCRPRCARRVLRSHLFMVLLVLV